jgi:hypothetical protein
MTDLTILFLTANQVPAQWAEYHRTILLEAAGEFPVVTVSRKPMNFGAHNILDTKPKCLSNIYWQMLQAAKLADTPFVAVAEDDCLYHASHFTFYRPKPDEFSYDQNRMGLFTWGRPTYNWRNRKSNCTLIAPRALLIEALEERFARWPDGTPDNITGEVGRSMVEKNLGITVRKSVEVFNDVSVIMVNHEYGSEERQKTKRKSMGPIRAYDVPYWGPASRLLSHFH